MVRIHPGPPNDRNSAGISVPADCVSRVNRHRNQSSVNPAERPCRPIPAEWAIPVSPVQILYGPPSTRQEPRQMPGLLSDAGGILCEPRVSSATGRGACWAARAVVAGGGPAHRRYPRRACTGMGHRPRSGESLRRAAHNACPYDLPACVDTIAARRRGVGAEAIRRARGGAGGRGVGWAFRHIRSSREVLLTAPTPNGARELMRIIMDDPDEARQIIQQVRSEEAVSGTGC